MVREECQREAELNKEEHRESPFTPAATAAEVQEEEEKGPGLLSKMLRQPGILAVRAVSLHNLLDQPPASSRLQPPPLVLHCPVPCRTLTFPIMSTLFTVDFGACAFTVKDVFISFARGCT